VLQKAEVSLNHLKSELQDTSLMMHELKAQLGPKQQRVQEAENTSHSFRKIIQALTAQKEALEQEKSQGNAQFTDKDLIRL
jgi:hypothetical protein